MEFLKKEFKQIETYDKILYKLNLIRENSILLIKYFKNEINLNLLDNKSPFYDEEQYNKSKIFFQINKMMLKECIDTKIDKGCINEILDKTVPTLEKIFKSSNFFLTLVNVNVAINFFYNYYKVLNKKDTEFIFLKLDLFHGLTDEEKNMLKNFLIKVILSYDENFINYINGALNVVLKDKKCLFHEFTLISKELNIWNKYYCYDQSKPFMFLDSFLKQKNFFKYYRFAPFLIYDYHKSDYSNQNSCKNPNNFILQYILYIETQNGTLDDIKRLTLFFTENKFVNKEFIKQFLVIKQNDIVFIDRINDSIYKDFFIINFKNFFESEELYNEIYKNICITYYKLEFTEYLKLVIDIKNLKYNKSSITNFNQLIFLAKKEGEISNINFIVFSFDFKLEYWLKYYKYELEIIFNDKEFINYLKKIKNDKEYKFKGCFFKILAEIFQENIIYEQNIEFYKNLMKIFWDDVFYNL